MPILKVKFFNDGKGYGFAESPEGDVFLHQSKIQMPDKDERRTLVQHQMVEVTVERGPKGLIATNIIPGNLPNPHGR